ncbi:hypothetical protein Q1695_012249 [Nippostrongylus brasiliensis]|nr:hypothetical protein Q1695_012249 [Nippostrongylus brasiliensis]
MAAVDEDMETDADAENRHGVSLRRKRPHLSGDVVDSHSKLMRSSAISTENSQLPSSGKVEVAGRVAGIELENFMCHGHLKVTFDTVNNNCFYIGGPNGSGKSALFASLNIGLGGRGNDNDRGSSVRTYIKEGKTKARIRLILTNRGVGSHPDFGDFIVVERNITPSSSTYVLKSITEKVNHRQESLVSKKKSDLDQLRVRLGIQLNNPIFWMSQDRSRHFLQQMKPDRLYKIFMHATELEHTRECYEKCEAIVESIDAMCRSMKGEFEKQKREYQSMVEECRRLRNIQEMRNQQSEDIQVMEKKRQRFQAELDVIQSAIEKNSKKKEQCTSEASALRTCVERKTEALRNLKEKMASMMSEIRGIRSDIESNESKRRQLESSRASFEKRRDRLTEQIAKYEEESQCEKRKEELAATKTKMDKVTQKESEVLENLRVAKQDRDDLQKASEQASFSRDECIREGRKVTGRVRDLEQEIHRAEMTSKNAVMRFGENIPRILEVLQANAEKFEYMPRGPIGMYIKVNDRRWAFAVEEATRRVLTSFVFNSKRDHQVFERLMRDNAVRGSLPNAIFSKFNVPAHNVTRNEPSSDWDTILRVIDVNDTVVRNVLIDMASAESTILLKNDEDARRIMDGNCPDKCVRAYTATGGMAMGRNRRGEGFYRFYACRAAPRTSLLTDQESQVDVSSMKAEVARLQDEKSRLQSRLKEVDEEASRVQDNLSKANNKLSAVEADLNRLRSQYRSLERTLEQLEMDDGYTVVDNMRASLNEINTQIAELDEEFKRLQDNTMQKNHEKSQLKSDYKQVEVDFSQQKEELLKLENQELEVQERMRQIMADFESDSRRAARIRESFSKMDENMAELETRKKEAEKTAERSENLPTPANMTIPPDMEQLADTAELDEQYKALTLKIESAEKVTGRTITAEQLRTFKENYETSKKQYVVLKSLNKKLAECIKIRKEKFPIMCHAITMRLKMTFQRLMATRSYYGNLVVDRQKETINISVATHQKDDNVQTGTKRVVQDLKGGSTWLSAL